jgi:uncharacterized protein YcaQ
VKAAEKVSARDARRFLRRVHLFDGKVRGVGDVLSHLGYVQIDPINVCGRMHDHILRNRVEGYREGGLMAHLHGDCPGLRKAAAERSAFEHHLPRTHVLAAFPLEAWPHLRAAMRQRTARRGAWMGGLTERERELAARILDKLGERGPISPEDCADDRRARRVWGSATLAKATLQKLFFHGRVLIAARQSNRRLYDLPERVLPGPALVEREPPAEETARWLAVLKLKQHRIARLRRDELAVVEDLVAPLAIEGCPTAYCLVSDLDLLRSPPVAQPGDGPLLLAPLDPVIYQRPLTLALWGFDYTWEVYTPAPRRTRGYYALPVLSGLELVGHVDLRADRQARALRVVSRSVRRGHRTAGAVGSLAAFLGLRRR